MKDIPPINPLFALVIGIAAVSTGAIFAKLAQAPPLVIAAYRVGIATIILAPIVCFTSRKELSELTYKTLLPVLSAGAFLSLHFAAWITSLSYTSVANSVILVNTVPLWVGLLSPLITREHMRNKTMIGIVISVIGGIIISAEDFSFEREAWVGDMLALAGGFCAAVYLMIGKTVRQRLSLPVYILLCYGSAAVILWLTVLFLNLQVTGFTSETVAAFWALAIIPQLIGHTGYNWSLKWLPTGLVAVSLLGEPVGSSVLAYFIFNEGFTWQKLSGGILILSAIYLASSKAAPNQFGDTPDEKPL